MLISSFLLTNYQKVTSVYPSEQQLIDYRKTYHNKNQQVRNSHRLGRINTPQQVLLKEYLLTCHPEELRYMRVTPKFANDLKIDIVKKDKSPEKK